VLGWLTLGLVLQRAARRANTRARRRLLVVALALMASTVYGAPAPARASGGASTTLVGLPVGGQVAGLAVSAGAVWVANARAGSVLRIDPRSNQVIASILIAEPLGDLRPLLGGSRRPW
jgi:streptogramin lyase